MTMSDAVPELVDWDLAAKTAKRLAGSGPEVTEAEAREVVDDLRRFAAEAEGYVRDVTGLDGSSASAPVVIVDRGGWVTANTDGLRTIVAPLARKVHEARDGRNAWPLDQLGPKATALETGAFLAFIAGRVLGQFDPFWSGTQPYDVDGPEGWDGAARTGSDGGARTARTEGPDGGARPEGWSGGTAAEHSERSDGEPANRLGRLLLVAPNVVHVERELGVLPRDFRLWVCLHEETHRVQFTAVPWLRTHLEGEIEKFLSATQVDSGALLANLREVVQALIRAVRGESDGISMLDLLQSPEQKAVVKRVTALMSLLEGHADVVMDRVGPDIVPTVETIRRRFQKRRSGSSGVDRAVRKVLGLEAKMRQYRDGARFVDEVVAQVGMDGFNRVWESPDTLPTPEEIADPPAWVRRVHGEYPR